MTTPRAKAMKPSDKAVILLSQQSFNVILGATHCSKCDYDEAEGELFQHCHSCCVKVINKIHAHFDKACAAAKKGK